MNKRSASAGDDWICGVNCDNEQGYIITTPVLNTCFNIGLNGNINIPYGLTTPGIATNIITASTSEALTLSADIVITLNTTINRNCSIQNNLSVLGNSEVSNGIRVKSSGQGGGNLRIEPTIDDRETSIGYYNRSDLRATVAGDVWVGGVSCWSRTGFAIGTPILASCLNIIDSGTVIANYILASPVVHTDILRGYVGDQITIDDAVIITGNNNIHGNSTSRSFVYNFTPAAVAQNTNAGLSYAQVRNGIITGLNISAGITYTLPLGISMGSNMDFLGNGTSGQYNQSFQWSIITMSSSTGNIIIAQSVGHTYVGNTTLQTTASYRCLTIHTASSTCTTHRICN